MTVRMAASGMIELAGACSEEDAEPLLRLLLSSPGAAVDWRECRGAHAAVAQVLMAARPRLVGPAGDIRLEDWLAPVLASKAE